MSGPDWDLLSSYVGLLGLACSSVYFGAFGSLSGEKLPRGAHKPGEPDEDSDDDEVITERLSTEDAWYFPVLGSITLFGLYLIVKYFGKEWINWFLGWYFAFAGVGSMWRTSVILTKWLVGPRTWKNFGITRIVIQKDSNVLLHLSWRTPTLFLFPVAILPSTIYALSSGENKPVVLSNVLSLSFAHTSLSILKLDSFATGAALLSGLFIYDIWWVFGTEVMAKVATNLDIPVKLLWPKSLSSDAPGYMLLGLGDVVVPGTFVALALRYDYHRSMEAKSVFKKPYFLAAFAAYVFGLSVSFLALNVFKAAQPALLYLSPACILSFIITAKVRGEFDEAWSWRDAPKDKHAVTKND